jgi:hypothetical protein
MFTKQRVKYVILGALFIASFIVGLKQGNRVSVMESNLVSLTQARSQDNATLNQNWQAQVGYNQKTDAELAKIKKDVSTLSRKAKGKKK